MINKQLPDLNYLNLGNSSQVQYQLTAVQLVEWALKRNEGTLAENGALAIDTGKFTGRSPKDRFIVYDDITCNSIWWGDINLKFDPEKFDTLFKKMTAYLSDKQIFVRDALACADKHYQIGVRVVTETAYQNLFVNHLFIRPEVATLSQPEWTVIAAPGFMANPETDGTRQQNFSIINFSRKMILIGGTGYTGEIKKGIFSVLNFLLPQHHEQVLPMHCSANVGANGDTAIFFGLSGTGKTTLSADAGRKLIGDDEHGWSNDGVFNFEGGCYAKCVGLSQQKEPQIYNAIKFGTLLENINFINNTRKVDFNNTDKTENTRAAYPLSYIDNALFPSKGAAPKNVFFLTADAFGILPPVAKLSPEQAMYHFIAGYTAKIAGTEDGVIHPEATFSACFGKAFLPLHPARYADLLGEKIKNHKVNVWLINTGWTGGAFGTGQRIPLKYTRAIINAALSGALNKVPYQHFETFNLSIPTTCADVPAELLNPRDTWADTAAYDQHAQHLAALFNNSFEQYESYCTPAVVNAGPVVTISV